MPGLRSWSTTHRFPRSRTSMRPRRRPTDRRRPPRRPFRSSVPVPRLDSPSRFPPRSSQPSSPSRTARGHGGLASPATGLASRPAPSGCGDTVRLRRRCCSAGETSSGEDIARGETRLGGPLWACLCGLFRSFSVLLFPHSDRSVSGLGRGVGNRPCRARHRFCSLEEYGAETVRRRRGAQKRLENGPSGPAPPRLLPAPTGPAAGRVCTSVPGSGIVLPFLPFKRVQDRPDAASAGPDSAGALRRLCPRCFQRPTDGT